MLKLLGVMLYYVLCVYVEATCGDDVLCVYVEATSGDVILCAVCVCWSY